MARDRMRLWTPAGVAGVELFDAHIVDHAFSRHCHDAVTLGINDGGHGRFCVDAAHHDATPYTVNLLAPGQMHTGSAVNATGWRYRNVYVDTLVLGHIAVGLEQASLPLFASPVARDRETWSAVDRVYRVLEDARPGARLARDVLLLELFSLLFARHVRDARATRPAGREPRAVLRARAILDEHIAEELSIDELAASVGLSPGYFVRTFHRHVGAPPHVYLQQRRLARARHALHGSQPLAAIAAVCGFCDQSHFTRVFKRAFGVSPGEYRRSVSSKTPPP